MLRPSAWQTSGILVRLMAIALSWCITVVAYAASSGRISFTAEDLNNHDEALFTVQGTALWSYPSSYRALFTAYVGGASSPYARLNASNKEEGISGNRLVAGNNMYKTPLQMLTCYAEGMELICDGRLEVRSRYGTAVYDTNTSLLYISPTDDIACVSLPLMVASPSPDGKWLCYARSIQAKMGETSSTEGCLILRNTANNKEYVIDKNTDVSYERLPVKWSPDSSLLVYSKSGNVYFCDVIALSRGVQIDEHYRRIGSGSEANVDWSVCTPLWDTQVAKDFRDTNLFHIEGDTIYRIDMRGLYTASIYADVIGRGKPCGRLPYKFDPRCDMFSVRKDGKAIVVLKGRSLATVYSIADDGSPLLQAISSVQLSDVTSSLVNASLMWQDNGDALVWTAVMPWDGKETCVVHRAVSNNSYKEKEENNTVLLQQEGKCSAPFLSPNGKRIAIIYDGMLVVYDTLTWRVIGKYMAQKVSCVVWDGNYAMYIGGDSSVSRWIVGDSSAEPLFPSAVLSAAWKNDSVVAVCPNGIAFKMTKEASSDALAGDAKCAIRWTLITKTTPTSQDAVKQSTLALPASTRQNGRYRLFCATAPNPMFKNALYVHSLLDLNSTKALCRSSIVKHKDKKRIALILDAYTNADYLATTLHILERSGIRGSFFINGAFIDRYPAQTRAIAMSGATCASMFFADTDLVGNRFVANTEFVTRGLGRNEDEFLRVTGKELSPIWHAPHYRANDYVRSSGNIAGYTYVDAVHMMDGAFDTDMTITQVLATLSSSKANALAIPVGSPLLLRLDALLGALLDNDYEIVGAEEL